MKKLIINPGDRFGKLTILSEVEKAGSVRNFKCMCDCGIIKDVRLNHLRNGHTQSCGCSQNRDLTNARKTQRENAKGITICGGYYVYTQPPNTKKFVHVLLYEQYLGRKLREGELVHHKNGNKLDNRIENLELMQKSDHMRLHINKRYKEGTLCNQGENSGNAKLTKDSVRFIRENYGKVRCKDLSQMFGVKMNTVCAVIKNETWRHI